MRQTVSSAPPPVRIHNAGRVPQTSAPVSISASRQAQRRESLQRWARAWKPSPRFTTRRITNGVDPQNPRHLSTRHISLDQRQTVPTLQRHTGNGTTLPTLTMSPDMRGNATSSPTHSDVAPRLSPSRFPTGKQAPHSFITSTVITSTVPAGRLKPTFGATVMYPLHSV
jgi:hypothetical protein